MKAVNLLPADRSVAKGAPAVASDRKRLLVACGIAGAVFATGLSVMVWSSSSSVSDKHQLLQSLQSKLASTTAATAAQSAAGAPARKTTVMGLVGDRLAWDQFLEALSKVVPEDVWLQSMQGTTSGAAATLASAQAAAAAAVAAAATPAAASTTTATTASAPAPASATSSTFTVTGFTYSQPSVARLMRRLSIVPWLANVSLVSSSKTTVGSDNVYQFTLKATVISPRTAQ